MQKFSRRNQVNLFGPSLQPPQEFMGYLSHTKADYIAASRYFINYFTVLILFLIIGVALVGAYFLWQGAMFDPQTMTEELMQVPKNIAFFVMSALWNEFSWQATLFLALLAAIPAFCLSRIFAKKNTAENWFAITPEGLMIYKKGKNQTHTWDNFRPNVSSSGYEGLETLSFKFRIPGLSYSRNNNDGHLPFDLGGSKWLALIFQLFGVAKHYERNKHKKHAEPVDSGLGTHKTSGQAGHKASGKAGNKAFGSGVDSAGGVFEYSFSKIFLNRNSLEPQRKSIVFKGLRHAHKMALKAEEYIARTLPDS